MSYYTYGEGEPILLIGGSANTSAEWNPKFIEQLAKNHTVITFDNRGTGDTTLGEKEFTIKQMTEDTYRLIQELDIKPDIMGHSMGGMIAIQLALEHPESFDKLILHNTRCGEKHVTQANPQIVQKTFETSAIPDNITILQYNAVIDWKSCDRLHEIKNPTLILSGTRDKNIPIKNSIYLDREIQDSELIRIENGTHSMMYQFPEEIGFLVNDFIQ